RGINNKSTHDPYNEMRISCSAEQPTQETGAHMPVRVTDQQFGLLLPYRQRHSPPCHADVRQPVYQGILFLDGPEESTSA
ncbi:hypothetical protein, partial [Micromonospora sp. LHW51205]